jgi:propionyl-CoA carboxylase beta chain
VIKTVTGEVIDQESLGGAAVHLSTSGLASLTAPSDQEAIATVRRLLGYLPSNNVDAAPVVPCADDPFRQDEALNHLVPVDASVPYSMHEGIERIVDQGSFLELQSTFATNAIIGFARMAGQTVGIVSQEPSSMAGVMDINASDKICRFVRFCDSFNIPIVTFVDCPGFIPGSAAEHGGIIRHGAKVLFAYAESTVPKVSVITRKAYGGAYIVMSSKPMGSDINYAWPSAEIAVMGPEGAANILFRKQIDSAADPAAERAKVVEDFRKKFLNPYAAAGADVIDDVIEPKETRERIITALSALRDKFMPTLPRKHGNMPV